MQRLNPDNIYIILHRVKGSLNAGYVARAMANTGFNHLRLSEPRCKLDSAAYRSAAAPQAHRILNRAKCFPTLPDSLEDLHYVVGTTARSRHNLATSSIMNATEKILRIAAQNPVGLLFGPEESGLSNKDLLKCDMVVMIPTSGALSSYNLAHSVLLICFMLMVNAGKKTPEGAAKSEIASHDNLEALFKDAKNTLLEIEFLNPQHPEHILGELRQLAGRAKLTPREVTLFRGMCRKTRTACRNKKKRGE